MSTKNGAQLLQSGGVNDQVSRLAELELGKSQSSLRLERSPDLSGKIKPDGLSLLP